MRSDRLNELEQFILLRGSATYEDIARNFNVSVNTVRRDLNELLTRGTIKKVYGGVTAFGTNAPLPMAVRTMRQREAKLAIGHLAASFVQSGTVLFLDSGSTTISILPHLVTKNKITIVTHSLSALNEAAKYPDLRVIALGGMYSPGTSSYVGATTLQTLSHMSFDLVFIAATGVTVERGLTNSTYFEVDIKRAVTQNNKRVVLMADNTKFGFSAPFTFCNFDQLYGVVTDKLPEQNYLDCINKNSIQLLYPET